MRVVQDLHPPSSGPGAVGAPRGFGHLPALDGVRGLAVVAVLVFHGGRLRGGYLGVDAFFVLSGFLITSLLLAEAAREGRIGLKAFWVRRIRRLLPALVIFILGMALYAVTLAGSHELARIRGDALATLGYVANWNAIFRQHGYWELFTDPSPLEHTWSLAIEEQFYVVWPLVVAGLVWSARRRGRQLASLVLWLSLGSAALSAGLMWWLYTPGQDTGRVYLGTDTRAAGILLGAALAAWRWRAPAPRPGWTTRRVGLETLAFVGAAGLLVAWASLDGQDPTLYRGGLLACGVGVVVLIAAVAHPQPGPLGAVLSLAPLRWVGLVSYGLYLWHWPIYLVLDAERTGLDGWALLAVRMAASTAVAVVSYRAFEQPIRSGRLRLLPMPVAVPIGALACVVALVLATGGQNIDTTSSISASTRSDAGRGSVAADPGSNSARRLLIVGDSVGGSIADGIRAVRGEGSLVVGDASVNGCALTPAVTGLELNTRRGRIPIGLSPTCEPEWASAVRTFDPDVIVAVFGNAAGFERFEIEGRWVEACDGRYRAWYTEQLSRILAALRATPGIRSRTLVVATAPYQTGSGHVTHSRDLMDCANADNRMVAQVVGAKVLDLGGMVCPAGRCVEEVDSTPLRADGIHFGVATDSSSQAFAGPGSEYVARLVLAELARVLGEEPPLAAVAL